MLCEIVYLSVFCPLRHYLSIPSIFSSFQRVPIVVLSQSRLYPASLILFLFSLLFTCPVSFPSPFSFFPLTSPVHFFPKLPDPPCAPSLPRPISNPSLRASPVPRSPALALFFACHCLPITHIFQFCTGPVLFPV